LPNLALDIFSLFSLVCLKPSELPAIFKILYSGFIKSIQYCSHFINSNDEVLIYSRIDI